MRRNESWIPCHNFVPLEGTGFRSFFGRLPESPLDIRRRSFVSDPHWGRGLILSAVAFYNPDAGMLSQGFFLPVPIAFALDLA